MMKNQSQLFDISSFDQEELGQQLKLEKIDSCYLFKQQSMAHDTDEPLFVQLLKKQDKQPHEEYLIYDRLKSLEKINIFLNEVLNGLDISQQVQLLSKAEYKRYRKGDILFSQGDKSNNKLYIILSGSVILYIKDIVNFEKMEESEEQFKLKLKGQKSESQNILQRNVNKFQIASKVKHRNQIQRNILKGKNLSKAQQKMLQERIKEQYPLVVVLKLKSILKRIRKRIDKLFNDKRSSISKYYLEQDELQKLKFQYGQSKVKVLTKGDLFGIQALMSNNVRTGTVVIDKDKSEILTIDKKDFDNSLQILKQIMQERQQLIFNSFKGSEDISYLSQIEIMYSFEPLTVQAGDTLAIEGDCNTEVEDDEEKDLCLYFVQDGEIIIEKTIVAQGSKPYENLRKEEVKHLATLTRGSLVGDELLIGNQYLFTAKVHSIKATVLQITPKKFKARFPRNVYQQQKKLSQIKIEDRIKKFEHAQQQLQLNFDNPQKLYKLQQQKNDKLMQNPTDHKLFSNHHQSQKGMPSQLNHVVQENQEDFVDPVVKQKYIQQQKKNIQEKEQHRKKGEVISYTVDQENQIMKGHKQLADKFHYETNKNKEQLDKEKLNIDNYIYDFGKGQTNQLKKNKELALIQQGKVPNKSPQPQQNTKMDPRLQKMYNQGKKARDSHILLKKQDSFQQIMGSVQYHARDYYHDDKQVTKSYQNLSNMTKQNQIQQAQRYSQPINRFISPEKNNQQLSYNKLKTQQNQQQQQKQISKSQVFDQQSNNPYRKK